MRAEDVRALVLDARDSPTGVTLHRTWIDDTLSLNAFTAYGRLKVGGSVMATGPHSWPGWRGGCALFLDNADIGGDPVLDGA